jgi:RimJ/RimL family protein N-acetyltransferase
MIYNEAYETQRLIIRRFRPEDSRDLHDYLSDPEVVFYEPYEVFSEAQSRSEAARRAEDTCFWAVCLKDGGKVIGNLYLSEGEYARFELGYVFNKTFWGQGFATESARALVNTAFSDFGAHRVFAMCNPENVKSWQLLERLGLRREGYLKSNVFFKKDAEGNPIWHDTYLYGVLVDDWQEIT